MIVTAEQVVALMVANEVLRRRLGEATKAPAPQVVNRVEPPAVYVSNEVGGVAVDTTPIAEAIARALPAANGEDADRVARVVAEALGRLADGQAGVEEMLSQLVQVLAAREPTELRPVIQVAAPEVTVEAPRVTVEAPRPAERPKRTLVIEHDDGTRSVVKEV